VGGRGEGMFDRGCLFACLTERSPQVGGWERGGGWVSAGGLGALTGRVGGVGWGALREWVGSIKCQQQLTGRKL